jgi:peptidylprolyl isomerase
MNRMRTVHLVVLAMALVLSPLVQAAAPQKDAAPAKPLSSSEILAASAPSDWRAPDAEFTFVMELASGPVIIELAPVFAPAHAESIRRLVRAGYFDGLAIIRVHDNYVTQWGDGEEDETKVKTKPAGMPKVPAEFDRALKGLNLTVLPDTDGWAKQVGFVDGWPVATDPKKGRAWLTHCYGMVGAGRGNEVDSSDGSSLYAVIGYPARGLDLNITTVGRVLTGIERLSALPRGTGPLGFYEKPEQRLPIARARMIADMPEAERPKLQLLRTDTKTWTTWLDSRRNRTGWFVHNPAHVDVCGVLPPVRTAP